MSGRDFLLDELVELEGPKDTNEHGFSFPNAFRPFGEELLRLIKRLLNESEHLVGTIKPDRRSRAEPVPSKNTLLPPDALPAEGLIPVTDGRGLRGWCLQEGVNTRPSRGAGLGMLASWRRPVGGCRAPYNLRG